MHVHVQVSAGLGIGARWRAGLPARVWVCPQSAGEVTSLHTLMPWCSRPVPGRTGLQLHMLRCFGAYVEPPLE